ncbi:glycosyltransferase family 2 protein [Salipiger aestuarii]|nr:glycosyltransferase family 2 protein [Salipiger aestuarii]KAA8614347.1 glycosyl transferase family 2 [Salipiger aestuarii]KAB2542836.1 glycosyl transferase family 2 [Salipiger aestuarii]
MRITAVTCVKNEGPFILEWIAFNRLIGVTDFLIYSNDCTDGTDALLDALAPWGVIHLPNPARGRNYQMEALKHAARQPVVRNADWVWIADVDEFLNIHAAGHDIPALVAACGTPQAISVSFQFFANDGVDRFQDAPVIGQFTRSHNPDLWCADTTLEVKTLVRRDFPLRYYGAHRPFAKATAAASAWTDGSGRAVPARFVEASTPQWIRRFPVAGARDHATLNHYALRSLESYLVKIDRGDVNREGRAFDDRYWRERNDPAWQDLSIRRYLPALETALSEMKQGRLARLHDACVRAHRRRAADVLRDNATAALRDHLRALPAWPPGELDLARDLGLMP